MMSAKKSIVYEKTIVIPIKKNMWKALKTISLEHEVSMSDLTRNALEKVINRYTKKDVDTEK